MTITELTNATSSRPALAPAPVLRWQKVGACWTAPNTAGVKALCGPWEVFVPLEFVITADAGQYDVSETPAALMPAVAERLFPTLAGAKGFFEARNAELVAKHD